MFPDSLLHFRRVGRSLKRLGERVLEKRPGKVEECRMCSVMTSWHSLHRNSGLRQSDEKRAAVKQICLVYLAQTIKRHQYLSPPSGGSKVPSWLRRSGRAWGPQWPSSTQGEPVAGCPAPVLPGPVHQARNEPNLLSETYNTHMLCFSRVRANTREK